MRFLRAFVASQMVLVICLSVPTVHGASYYPALPQEVEFSVEQAGPSPYPYQGLRVRATLRNISKKTIGPLRPLEGYLWIFIKPAREAKFTPVNDITRDPHTGTPMFIGREPLAPLVPITLKPGEQTSLSVLLAVHWPPTPGKAINFEEGKALFQKAGPYDLKFRYLADAKDEGREHVYTEKQIAIQVQELAGEDRAVYQFLAQNPQLDAMLLLPHLVPQGQEILDVLSILELYPKSSYGDYARFALARAYLKAASREPASTNEARTTTGLNLLAKCAADFPLRPSVLRWQRDRLLDLKHEELALKVEAELLTAYADSTELLRDYNFWLLQAKWREMERNSGFLEFLHQRSNLKKLSAEDWEAFRKRIPKKP